MSTSGLINPRTPSYDVDILKYIEQPKGLVYGQNLQDYSNKFGTYVSGNGSVSGKTPSLAAVNAVDGSKAPSVFNEKGFNDWSVNEAGKIGNTGGGLTGSRSSVGSNTFSNPVGLSYDSVINSWSPEQWQNFGSQGGTIDANNNLVFGTKNLSTTATEPGMFDKTMNFLGSDSMKGLGTIAGIGTDIFGIMNTMKSQKQAKHQWEAENARANEIMAMNREKYETYKADKARLNSQY